MSHPCPVHEAGSLESPEDFKKRICHSVAHVAFKNVVSPQTRDFGSKRDKKQQIAYAFLTRTDLTPKLISGRNVPGARRDNSHSDITLPRSESEFYHHPQYANPAYLLECSKGLNDDSNRSTALIAKIRIQNVLWLYSALDSDDKGYIDIVATACRLRARLNQIKTLATKQKLSSGDAKSLVNFIQLLATVLTDLQPYVSSRGVVERDVALQTLRQLLDTAGPSCPTYGPLRVRSKRLCTEQRLFEQLDLSLGSKPFYRGTYIPEGLNRKLENAQAASEFCKVFNKTLRTKELSISGLNSEHSEFARKGGCLADHAARTQSRKQVKIAQLRKEEEACFRKACPFRPVLQNKHQTHSNGYLNSEENVDGLVAEADFRAGLHGRTMDASPRLLRSCNESCNSQKCSCRNGRKSGLRRQDTAHYMCISEHANEEEPPYLFFTGDDASDSSEWQDSLRNDWNRRLCIEPDSLHEEIYQTMSKDCRNAFDHWSQKRPVFPEDLRTQEWGYLELRRNLLSHRTDADTSAVDLEEEGKAKSKKVMFSGVSNSPLYSPPEADAALGLSASDAVCQDVSKRFELSRKVSETAAEQKANPLAGISTKCDPLLLSIPQRKMWPRRHDRKIGNAIDVSV